MNMNRAFVGLNVRTQKMLGSSVKFTSRKERMLRGKRCLLTGGGSGIGAAIAKRFVAEGAKVVSADINAEVNAKMVEALNKEFGANSAFAVTCDASKEDQVEATVARAAELLGGGFDTLVNNAVIFIFGNLLPPGTGSGTGTDREATADMFRRSFEVNVIGYASFIKHAARVMNKNELAGRVYENEQPTAATASKIDARERGSIVNIASVSSWISQPEFVPYNASKASILALTRCCAKDFAPLKIRVNAISPGSIETPGSHNHMKLIGKSIEEGRQAFSDCCDMKRQGAPEELAAVAAFLASENASFMTGSNLVCDGGATYY